MLEESNTLPLLGAPGAFVAYNSTTTTPGPHDDDSTEAYSTATDSSSEHKTTVRQTFIHLLKGYIGPGCLSLPWAVSQLGITGGFIAIFSMSYWSSYNCWTVVKLKRYMERQTSAMDVDEKGSVAASSVTYPDVGEWLWGTAFQSYVSACICTQQLAICTVFISFIGQNLLAVFEQLHFEYLSTHVAVMTLALPFVLSLSFIPNLKQLTPVMVAGTVLLLMGFAVLGLLVVKEWPHRPTPPPTMNLSQAPLAFCAILYSYEGICLILPIESAMKEPKHFKRVFCWSMLIVALLLAAISSLCVLAFGNVTNGSVTAFLVEAYADDASIRWWLMVANTAVSLSVLLTYPLQIFPALELMGPWFRRTFLTDGKDEEVDDLSAFEPLPPLPEHSRLLHEDTFQEHQYGMDEEEESDEKDDDDVQSLISNVTAMFPKMTMPGDSPQMRAVLVILTYLVAVVIPNVQALISLAGALAGSSTALLIPPMLELAWIRHLETSVDLEKVDESQWLLASKTRKWFGKWWMERLKCYVLLFMGLIFFAIGTYASLADIISIYLGNAR